MSVTKRRARFSVFTDSEWEQGISSTIRRFYVRGWPRRPRLGGGISSISVRNPAVGRPAQHRIRRLGLERRLLLGQSLPISDDDRTLTAYDGGFREALDQGEPSPDPSLGPDKRTGAGGPDGLREHQGGRSASTSLGVSCGG